MKSKQSTYILIAIVALVWGAIIYRVVMHFKGPQENVTVAYDFDKVPIIAEVDSGFKLKLNYKDPFLKHNYYPRSTERTGVVQNKQSGSIRNRIYRSNKPKSPVKVIKWPDIQYGGIILNDQTKEKLGLIQIDDESILFRKNEKRIEITLLELYADSVRVSYQEEEKTVVKTN